MDSSDKSQNAKMLRGKLAKTRVLHFVGQVSRQLAKGAAKKSPKLLTLDLTKPLSPELCSQSPRPVAGCKDHCKPYF